jgi:hypothetical protein
MSEFWTKNGVIVKVTSGRGPEVPLLEITPLERATPGTLKPFRADIGSALKLQSDTSKLAVQLAHVSAYERGCSGQTFSGHQ